MSPKTGRPKSQNPKNIRLEIRMSQDEANDLQEVADKLQTTKTGAIKKGIELLKSKIK